MQIYSWKKIRNCRMKNFIVKYNIKFQSQSLILFHSNFLRLKLIFLTNMSFCIFYATLNHATPVSIIKYHFIRRQLFQFSCRSTVLLRLVECTTSVMHCTCIFWTYAFLLIYRVIHACAFFATVVYVWLTFYFLRDLREVWNVYTAHEIKCYHALIIPEDQIIQAASTGL